MSTEETNVVTATEVAPLRVPKSFKELKKAELVAAALAFGADEDGSADAIRADLTELGVTWEDYMKAFHPEEPPAVEPEPFVMPEPTNVEDWPDAEEEVEMTHTVVTAEAVPQLAPQDKYLIKMTRKNPYFEFGRYKFTQEKPYAIMPAADAQSILESEDGFRQAYPAELNEFYS